MRVKHFYIFNESVAICDYLIIFINHEARHISSTVLLHEIPWKLFLAKPWLVLTTNIPLLVNLAKGKHIYIIHVWSKSPVIFFLSYVLKLINPKQFMEGIFLRTHLRNITLGTLKRKNINTMKILDKFKCIYKNLVGYACFFLAYLLSN